VPETDLDDQTSVMGDSVQIGRAHV
jgi:hypothetical protein